MSSYLVSAVNKNNVSQKERPNGRRELSLSLSHGMHSWLIFLNEKMDKVSYRVADLRQRGKIVMERGKTEKEENRKEKDVSLFRSTTRTIPKRLGGRDIR